MSLNITSLKIDSENLQQKQENIPKKLSNSLKKLAAQDESSKIGNSSLSNIHINKIQSLIPNQSTR